MGQEERNPSCSINEAIKNKLLTEINRFQGQIKKDPLLNYKTHLF